MRGLPNRTSSAIASMICAHAIQRFHLQKMKAFAPPASVILRIEGVAKCRHCREPNDAIWTRQKETGRPLESTEVFIQAVEIVEVHVGAAVIDPGDRALPKVLRTVRGTHAFPEPRQ